MDLRNSDLRARRAQQGPADTEHLTEAEVERLIKATQDSRYSHRVGLHFLLEASSLNSRVNLRLSMTHLRSHKNT
jgi:hypothetical protein